jgi:NitT/TauT family transport system substrate-binding protein
MSRPFTFYLDWVLGAQFAGLYWARDKGLYEAAGLEVSLEPWSDQGGSLFEKVSRTASEGRLSAGCVEDNLIVKQASAGHSLMAFGAMLQETPMVLMSPIDRPIRQLANLRGKRVGMHADGIRALEMVLALDQLPVRDVAVEIIDFDLDHLRHGRFDAVQGYVMTEPIQLAAAGFDVNVMPIKHHRFQPYAQVYFAERGLLERYSTVFADFLSASSAGWVAVCASPDEAADLLSKAMRDPSQRSAQRRMIERVIPLVLGELPPAKIGTIDVEQWNRNLTTYFDFGVTDRRNDLRDVVFSLP